MLSPLSKKHNMHVENCFFFTSSVSRKVLVPWEGLAAQKKRNKKWSLYKSTIWNCTDQFRSRYFALTSEVVIFFLFSLKHTLYISSLVQVVFTQKRVR